MDQTCLAETGFTASDFTGRTYTVYRIVLFRLNLQKHGAVSRMFLQC